MHTHTYTHTHTHIADAHSVCALEPIQNWGPAHLVGRGERQAEAVEQEEDERLITATGWQLHQFNSEPR